MGALAKSEDPDEIPHDAYIEVCYLFRQVRISVNDILYLFEKYKLSLCMRFPTV